MTDYRKCFNTELRASLQDTQHIKCPSLKRNKYERFRVVRVDGHKTGRKKRAQRNSKIKKKENNNNPESKPYNSRKPRMRQIVTTARIKVYLPYILPITLIRCVISVFKNTNNIALNINILSVIISNQLFEQSRSKASILPSFCVI